MPGHTTEKMNGRVRVRASTEKGWGRFGGPLAQWAVRSGVKRRLQVRPRTVVTVVCALILALVVIMSIFPQLFASADPLVTRPAARLQPPGVGGLLGTDYLGRDIYSRVVYGARLSLPPSLAVVAVAGAFGSLLGVTAGYVGSWLDEALMRLADIFLAVPGLILAMAIATALGPSVRNAAIAVIVVWWPGYARLARSETQVLRNAEYVQAASAIGASHLRILFRHIFPNQLSSIIIKASLDAGQVLLIMAGLGFLGIGAQAPTPEWGLEVTTAREYLFFAPWYVFAPGGAIFLTVYSLNVVGDAIRERIDPRLRTR